jgi:hypothetical protein
MDFHKKFGCIVVEKIKSKFLLSSLKFLINFENPFRNDLQRFFSENFDPENAYRKPPVKSNRKLPRKSKFWGVFPAANEGLSLENID